jgi:hypothetical protein
MYHFYCIIITVTHNMVLSNVCFLFVQLSLFLIIIVNTEFY